jgi:hypothetical protein
LLAMGDGDRLMRRPLVRLWREVMQQLPADECA